MISIAKLEDALKTDVKANITGVKSAMTHEADIDVKAVGALMPLTPFVLVRWGGLAPQADDRMADEASGTKKSRFFLSVGATSLLSKEDGQRGCYTILDALIDRYDGGTVTTNEGSIDLALESADFIFSESGLIVYGVEFSYYDN